MIAKKPMSLNDQKNILGGIGPNPSDPPDGDETFPDPLNTGNQTQGGV